MHRSLQLVPTLSQINLIHAIEVYLIFIYLILSSHACLGIHSLLLSKNNL
jgi:hypothetical protein